MLILLIIIFYFRFFFVRNGREGGLSPLPKKHKKKKEGCTCNFKLNDTTNSCEGVVIG
jgi:hypothetical protein